MKIWKYASYKEYLDAQVEANVRKLKHVWVTAATVDKIREQVNFEVHNILCHGTRNGAEQKLFAQRFQRAFIVGTEISPTATDFPNTVQWDFHDPKEEWLNHFDIVYSNSWDHSYDPEKSLSTWRNQLRVGGMLFLELGIDPDVNKSQPSDPLQIDPEEVAALLEKVGLSLRQTSVTVGGKNKASMLYMARRLA